MGERLEEKLIELIDLLVAYLKQGGGAVGQQAPLAIQEYLDYCLVSSLLRGAVLVVVALLLWRLLGRLDAYLKERLADAPEFHGALMGRDDYRTCRVVCGAGRYGGAVYFFWLAFTAFLQAVKVLVAPRVVALDWLTGMLP